MRNSVPIKLIAGESLSWQKSFANHPASEGWTLVYYFRGGGTGFNIAGVADGADFTITVAPAVSGLLSAGKYSYQGFAALGAENILVDAGELTIMPSLAAIDAAESFDGRSPVKILLDAIDALMLGKATLDQQKYVIGTRQLDRIPIPDLIALRKEYSALYAQELKTAELEKGNSPFRQYKTKFVRPR